MAEKDKFIVEYTTKDLFDKIDNMEDNLYKSINELNNKFDCTINGNGKEGMKQRLTKTEEAVKFMSKIFYALCVPIIVLIAKEAIVLFF